MLSMPQGFLVDDAGTHLYSGRNRCQMLRDGPNPVKGRCAVQQIRRGSMSWMTTLPKIIAD